MARIIACANQKGGVGKTTTAFNLSAALVARGQRVLLVDLDPQANTTITFGLELGELRVSVADLLLHKELHPRYTTYQRRSFHLIPANLDLEQAALKLHAVRMRELQLRQVLATVEDQYDFIFIDCPPSIGLLTENALTAAELVIIPVEVGFYSLVGVTQILGAIEEIKELNPGLGLGGLVATKVRPGHALSDAVVAKLRSDFQEQVFTTVIRQCDSLAEAPSHGQSILEYNPQSAGAADYIALAKEVHQWMNANPSEASASPYASTSP